VTYGEGTARGRYDRVVATPRIAPATGREAFEVPADVAYFNTANMSPLLASVRVAGEAALGRRAAPWTIGSDDWFTDVERLRSLAARLVGTDADGVALVPASSYGLAIAARNLVAEPGDRILVLDEEYPSNRYTWQRVAEDAGADLVTVEREPGEPWTPAVVRRIDDRTRVVAVPNVHWTNGALVDLEPVAAAVHDRGAALVIDASQSLGAMPLDLGRLDPDFVVSVGYKWLLGPLGVGPLYVAERHRGGRPIEENWINREGSEDFTALVDYTDRYQPGARRFDVGQRSNFGLVPMAVAALEQLLEWRVEAVAEELARLTAAIAERVGRLGVGVIPAAERGPHILGIELPGKTTARVVGAMRERGVVASVRGRSLRIAPHLHVRDADVDRLVDAIAAGL
jgi:selenocysteine lyase/cysteine desulfurase